MRENQNGRIDCDGTSEKETSLFLRAAVLFDTAL